MLQAFEKGEMGDFIQTVSPKENRSDCRLKKRRRTRVLQAFEKDEMGDFIQPVSLKENRSDCAFKRTTRTLRTRASAKVRDERFYSDLSVECLFCSINNIVLQ